jgi:hypothetical protein
MRLRTNDTGLGSLAASSVDILLANHMRIGSVSQRLTMNLYLMGVGNIFLL